MSKTRRYRSIVAAAMLGIAALLLASCGGEQAADPEPAPEAEDPDPAEPEADEPEDDETEADEPEADEPEPAADLVEFVAPVTGYRFHAGSFPLAVGLARGHFAEQGLRPTWLDTAGGGEPVRVFTATDTPVGVVGTVAALPAIVAGEEFKIIGTVLQRSDTWIAVRADSDIQSVADLRGATIGATRPGSTLDTVVKAALASEGMTEEDAQIEYLGSVAELSLALDEGLVDAIASAGQVLRASKEVVEGEWRTLGTGDQWTPIIDAVLVAKNDTIENNPDLLHGFVQAWRDSVDYIAAHAGDEELTGIAADWQQRHDPDDAPALAAMVEDLGSIAHDYWGDLSIDMDAMEAVAQELVDTGVLDEVPADWDAIVDLSFVTR